MPQNVDQQLMSQLMREKMGGAQQAPTRNLWRELMQSGSQPQRHVFREEIMRQVPEAAVPISRPDLSRTMTFDDEGNVVPEQIPPSMRSVMLRAMQQYMRMQYGADASVI